MLMKKKKKEWYQAKACPRVASSSPSTQAKAATFTFSVECLQASIKETQFSFSTFSLHIRIMKILPLNL